MEEIKKHPKLGATVKLSGEALKELLELRRNEEELIGKSVSLAKVAKIAVKEKYTRDIAGAEQ